eukprot:scaffold597_cov176-Amphora_coffeaeformis.AAC.24
MKKPGRIKFHDDPLPKDHTKEIILWIVMVEVSHRRRLNHNKKNKTDRRLLMSQSCDRPNKR